ncbi:MAG: helix-turn-helix transcriptional regulator [Thermoguttaceae bacterium]|jgi:DNA-binding PadR family transcriptional regulator|nr:helix-turn-helix transcriptional regulator [Thermoguttaceae bacterium]
MSDSGDTLALDLAQCPCAGGTLDRLIQPAILIVLAEGPLHGYRIAERIGHMPTFGDHPPDVSGVYRFLRSMEGKGLVVSTWETSESGPAKRAYQITPAGNECLRRWVETLRQYREAVAAVLKAAAKAARDSTLNPRPLAGRSPRCKESMCKPRD